MLSTPQLPKQNRLLAALPQSNYARLVPALELLALPLGLGVYEAGSKQSHAYFPIDSIISLVYVMTGGATTEIAVTGNDGMVGIPLIMGGETTSNRAVVRNAGYAYRLRVAVLKSELENNGPFQNLLLRYTQSLMTQIAQNSVCARHHTVEQRLCRWLLMSFDLMPSDKLMTTHAQIANMLGVRREVVTAAAGNLQRDELIRCNRGYITALDRTKLEMRVCECYAAVKHEANRLIQQCLPDSSPISRPLHPPRKLFGRMYSSVQISAQQYGIISSK
jgi:CRP-like cAMP-binding protein